MADLAPHDDPAPPGERSQVNTWPHGCDLHEGVPAWAVCSKCGRFVCRTCFHQSPDKRFALCPTCRNPTPKRPTAAAGDSASTGTLDASQAATEGLDDPSPGSVAAFPRTALRVILGPRRFFAALPESTSLGRAFTFGVACSTLGTLFALAWASALTDGPSILEQIGAESGLPPLARFGVLLLVVPLVGALEVGIYTALITLGMRLFKIRATYSGVMRIASYALASKLLFVIPWIGSFFAVFSLLSSLMAGLRERLEAPFDKALIVVAVTVVLTMLLGLGGGA